MPHTFTAITDTISDREKNGKDQLLEMSEDHVFMLVSSRFFTHYLLTQGDTCCFCSNTSFTTVRFGCGHSHRVCSTHVQTSCSQCNATDHEHSALHIFSKAEPGCF